MILQGRGGGATLLRRAEISARETPWTDGPAYGMVALKQLWRSRTRSPSTSEPSATRVGQPCLRMNRHDPWASAVVTVARCRPLYAKILRDHQPLK